MEDITDTLVGGTHTSTEGTQINAKTFTQDDVNRIVQERVAKEQRRLAGNNGEDELIRRAAELDQRERRLNAVETLRKEGLPDYLVDALNMNTDEDFQKSLEAIKKMKGDNPKEEPKVIGYGSPIGNIGSGNKSEDCLKKAFGLK